MDIEGIGGREGRGKWVGLSEGRGRNEAASCRGFLAVDIIGIAVGLIDGILYLFRHPGEQILMAFLEDAVVVHETEIIEDEAIEERKRGCEKSDEGNDHEVRCRDEGTGIENDAVKNREDEVIGPVLEEAFLEAIALDETTELDAGNAASLACGDVLVDVRQDDRAEIVHRQVVVEIVEHEQEQGNEGAHADQDGHGLGKDASVLHHVVCQRTDIRRLIGIELVDFVQDGTGAFEAAGNRREGIFQDEKKEDEYQDCHHYRTEGTEDASHVLGEEVLVAIHIGEPRLADSGQVIAKPFFHRVVHRKDEVKKEEGENISVDGRDEEGNRQENWREEEGKIDEEILPECPLSTFGHFLMQLVIYHFLFPWGIQNLPSLILGILILIHPGFLSKKKSLPSLEDKPFFHDFGPLAKPWECIRPIQWLFLPKRGPLPRP